MDGLVATLQRKTGGQTYDLGVIKGVTMTYTSSVTNSPVILWGYTGSFTMDSGVS